MALAFTEGYTREIRFTYAISACEQPRPSSCLQRPFTRELMFVMIRPLIFLFSFVIEMIMKITLSSCENSDIDTCLDMNLCDLEYADDIMLPSGTGSE